MRIIALIITVVCTSCAGLNNHSHLNMRRPAEQANTTDPAIELQQARSCMANICKDRSLVLTTQKLERANRDQTKYRQSPFFNKIDRGFQLLKEHHAQSQRRRKALIQYISTHRTETSADMIAFRKIQSINTLLTNYVDAVDKYITYEHERQNFISTRQAFALDLTFVKNLPEFPTKNILLEFMSTTSWYRFSRLLSNGLSADFNDAIKTSPSESDLAVVSRFRAICTDAAEDVARWLGATSEVFSNTVQSCKLAPELILESRALKDQLIQRSQAISALQELVSNSTVSSLLMKYVITDSDLNTQMLESQLPTSKECHAKMAIEWNISHWPSENKKQISKDLENLISEIDTTFSDMPENKIVELKGYLNSHTLTWPDDEKAFEKRSSSQLENYINMQISDSKFSKLSLADRAIHSGLFLVSTDRISSFCHSVETARIPDSYSSANRSIQVGVLGVRRPQYAIPILAHELGHAISSYFKVGLPLNRLRKKGGYYAGLPMKVRVWEARACINTLHGNLDTDPDSFLFPNEGSYTEEDFADYVALSLIRRFSEERVANFSCAFDQSFDFHPRKRSRDPYFKNISSDRHSNNVFRAIHFQKMRGLPMPKACGLILEKTPTCFQELN